MIRQRISRSIRRFSVISLAGLAAVLSGCDGVQAAGDIVVDELPTFAVERGLRIGDFDDPDTGFSRVSAIDVDGEGNVYVLEASVPEIRVYDPDGVLLRRIGRRGGGPGEFERSPRFGVLGDTIWTLDNLSGRITLFSRDGKVLSSGTAERVIVPLPTSLGYVRPWLMRPDGRFTSYLGLVGSMRGDPPSGVLPTDSIPVPFILFDADGSVADTLGWLDRPPPRMWRPPSDENPGIEFTQVGTRRVMVPQPPTTLPWWLALRDGYVSVESPLAETEEDGIFTVTRIGVAGDTVFSRSIHYRPTRYSAADLDSIASRAARGEAGGMVPIVMSGGAPAVPPDWQRVAGVLRDAMDFPDFRLPIEYPWLAQDGSVWMRLDSGNDPTARWLVLNPAGGPRGTLELPADVRVLWNRGDTFWAVDPDELGVPWVVRFSMRPE